MFLVANEIDLCGSIRAGIRLEDNVLVTATGMKTLTNVPREVEDVERVLAGGEWPVVASTPSPAQK